MIAAENAAVWINRVKGMPSAEVWCDPIGAAYTQWQNMDNQQRMQLMLETAIDLAMQGFPLVEILEAFAQVTEFRALGERSYPMCRALTSALIGQCLEPNTMGFEELLSHYGPATDIGGPATVSAGPNVNKRG